MGSLPTKLRALSVEKPKGCCAVVPAGLGVKTHCPYPEMEKALGSGMFPFEAKNGHHSLLNHSSAHST